MADEVAVSIVTNNLGQAISENVTFSDKQNHNMTIVGVPGARYSLTSLPSNGGTPSAITVSGGATGSNPPNTTGISTPVQSPNPVEVITFTDSSGNTLTLLGAPNTVYDLTLLPYLLAVVSALDVFATMQFGSDYENIKIDYLQRVGLV
jgi:hypothetical protein